MSRPVRSRLRELRRPAPLPAAGPTRGREPTPLTPDGAGFRFADLTLSPDGREIWCVREISRPDDGRPEPGFHTGGGTKVNRAIVAVPLDGSAAEGHPGSRHRGGLLRVPHPVAGRHASWRGSTGTIRGCRGTGPSCGSAPSPGSTAASGRRLGADHGRSRRSRCWRRAGATTSPCTRSPTRPAGGTCTRWPPRPGPPRARCTRPRRSSPGRCGSSAAARSSCSRTAGSRCCMAWASCNWRRSTRRRGRWPTFTCPATGPATPNSPYPVPRSPTWPAARPPRGRCCGSFPPPRARPTPRSRSCRSSRSPGPTPTTCRTRGRCSCRAGRTDA